MHSQDQSAMLIIFSIIYLVFNIGQAEGNFHKIVLNKQLQTAYDEFRDFIVSELKQQQNDGAFLDLTQTKA